MNKNIYNIQELIRRVPKKFLFLYGVIISLCAVSFFVYIYPKTRASKKNSKTTSHISIGHPQEIKVIAWDLHEVLFYGKPSMVKSIWKYKQKRKLFPGGKIVKLILKDFKRIMTRKEKAINSTRFIKTALEQGLDELAEFMIAYESDCKPKKEMLAVIKKLDALGYKQYVCSNISSYGFDRLSKKYPELFKYFSGIYTTREKNGSKPQERFFRLFLQEFNLDAKTVLFIDDKKENCRGAQKLGIHALCFNGKQKKARLNSINEIYRTLNLDNNAIVSTSNSLGQQGIS